MITKPVALLCVGTALLLGGASPALAHAFLERAVPAVGSAVHGSPPEVRLSFSEELEPAFSTIRVLDPGSKQIDKADKQIVGTVKSALRVSLPALAPGTYRVIWRVLSVDAHATEGAHTFEVLP